MTTIRDLNSKIKKAQADAFITAKEAAGVVKAAAPVTPARAKAVAELFERGTPDVRPGMMMTMAIPESPGQLILEQGARTKFEGFFEKNGVPAGQQKAIFKERAQRTLDRAAGFERGGVAGPAGDATPDPMPKLAAAPKRLKWMFDINLTPEGLMDMTKTAYIDTKKDEMYLRQSGWGPAGAMRSTWYGPMKLAEPLADDGGMMHTMAFPEGGGDQAITLAVGEGAADGGMMHTMAIPEGGGDQVFTQAVGEGAADGGGMQTMAFPEGGGDRAITLAVGEGAADGGGMQTMAFLPGQENGADRGL